MHSAQASSTAVAAPAAASVVATAECRLCQLAQRSASARVDAATPLAVQLLQQQFRPLRVRAIVERQPLLQHLPLRNWKMNLLALSPTGGSLFIGGPSSIVQLPLSAAGVPRVIESRVPLGGITHGYCKCGAASEQHQADCGLLQSERSAAASSSVTAAPADGDEKEEEDALAAPTPPGSAPTHERPPPPRNADVAHLFEELLLPSGEAVAEGIPAAPAELNALRVGYIGWRPVLAAACNDGHSCLFDLQRLASLRFGQGGGVGNNGNIEPDLVRLNKRARWADNSAWSLAMSPRGSSAPVVAIGSNAARAFLWKPASPLSDAEIAASGRATYVPAGHNVPSVDISSCGRFIALSCIDTVLRVARLDGSEQEAEFVATKEIDSQWGWCVRWIAQWACRQRSCTLEQMKQHREHGTLADEVQRLLPTVARAPPLPADANPLVERMLVQLMRQFGDHQPPEEAEVLRADLRRQLAQLVARQQAHEGGDNDEAVEDEDAEFADAGDDEDAAEDEFADEEGEDEEDDDGGPPELAEEQEEQEAEMATDASVATAAGSEASGTASKHQLESAQAELPSDLLLYASKSHLYLLDISLNGQTM